MASLAPSAAACDVLPRLSGSSTHPSFPAGTGEARSSAGTRVLLVDDDRSVLQVFGALLRKAGFQVATATAADPALAAARVGFDVMLLDVRLGKDDGLEVLRTIRQERIPGRVIVITGFDLDGVECQARLLGAEFVDRWTLPDPVELVARAPLHAPQPGDELRQRPVTPPALSRWAEAVAGAVASPDEPKSVSSWARIVGRSSASLRGLCTLAGVSPKNSCTLARVLRAVYLAWKSGRMNVAEWIDVADDRTLKHLLDAAGMPEGTPVSIDEVLQRQRLIAHDAALALLNRALRTRGLL